MEFIETHTAKDGFKADIYRSKSSITDGVLYSVYKTNQDINFKNRLFGGAYFNSLQEARKMIG